MELEQAVLHFFASFKGVASLHLFGSQAQNRSKPGSDVDIAVLFDPHAIPLTMDLIETREALADTLGKSVDLVCLNNASPIIAMQVVQQGKVLIINDQRTYNAFLIRLFSEYPDLKRFRAPMEEGMLKRKYYG